MDSAGTATYKRDGAGVTAPVLSDSSAVYTPGISERRSSTTKFYGTDRLGTNSLETNSSQTVTSTKTYDAFGMLQASTGSSASPFGFAGKHGYQEDGDSGLKLLGHRYYDASTGRFLTRDPIKSGRNWYGYCRNNPLKYVDPTGNDEKVLRIIREAIRDLKLPDGTADKYKHDPAFREKVHREIGDRKIDGGKRRHNDDLDADGVIEAVEDALPQKMAAPSPSPSIDWQKTGEVVIWGLVAVAVVVLAPEAIPMLAPVLGRAVLARAGG